MLIVLMSCQSEGQRDSRQVENSNTSEEISPKSILIDSTILLNTYSGMSILIDSAKYSTLNNESVFSFIKTKAKYQVIDSLTINEVTNAKIIYADFQNLGLDGLLSVVFIGTFDSKGEQIDLLRIGKLEQASDYFAYESSQIQNFEIEKTIYFSGVELDSIWTEQYRINQNGQIRLKK